MLLVGVLVVGIVVYIAYRSFRGSGISEQECRAKLISWCSSCSLLNYTTSLQIGQELADCANDYFSSGWASTDDCNGAAKTRAEVIALCQTFI